MLLLELRLTTFGLGISQCTGCPRYAAAHDGSSCRNESSASDNASSTSGKTSAAESRKAGRTGCCT